MFCPSKFQNFLLLFLLNSFNLNGIWGAPSLNPVEKSTVEDSTHLSRPQRSYPVMDKETGRIYGPEEGYFIPQGELENPYFGGMRDQPRYFPNPSYQIPPRFAYPSFDVLREQPPQNYRFQIQPSYLNGNPGAEFVNLDHSNKRSSGYMCHFKLCQLGASGKRRWLGSSIEQAQPSK